MRSALSAGSTRGLGAATVAVVVAGTAASGDVVRQAFIAKGPTGHKAAAIFVFNDQANVVMVRVFNLTNPAFSSADSRALTAMFWDMNSGSTSLKHIASVGGPSVNNPQNLTVAQMWAVRGGTEAAATPFQTRFALGAAGLGPLANTTVMAPGGSSTAPGGIDGGLLSATGDPYAETMFRTSAKFFFKVDESFFANGIHNIQVGNIRWQFGESFGDPVVHVVPLPPAAGAGVAGLLGLACFGFLRRRALRRTVA